MSAFSRQRVAIAAGLVVLFLAIGWYLRPPSFLRNNPGMGSAAYEAPSTKRSPRPIHDPETSAGADANTAISKIIARFHEEFARSPDAETSREILESLRQSIREAADEQATAVALGQFLNSGTDVATKLPFEVGEEGMLETAPTLRTALLDLLVTLDPTLALDVARSIMDDTSSPDEYAIALRNLAWNDLEGDLHAELATRFQQLIARDDWRRTPSAGFLEAFDAAVQLNSSTQFTVLLELAIEGAGTANPSLTRASMMALDRMTLRNPDLLTRQFSSDPSLAGIDPKLRASLLSRLDLTDSTQREIFATYLTTATHGEGEMEYFGQLFPNGNYLHGHWMITTPEATPSIAQRAEEDRKVLAQLQLLATEVPSVQASQAFVSIKSRLEEVTYPDDSK